MNKFITICGTLSALALIALFFNWLFKPSTPTVILTASEWMCVESVPKGLNAECTVYNRAPTKTGAKQ